jgi:broad-specificity NMP kinase
MNTEKLLRLLFPKTIQKIENDMANKTYDALNGYPEDEPEWEYQYDEEYEMRQAEIFEEERIADEHYREMLDLDLLQDKE